MVPVTHNLSPSPPAVLHFLLWIDGEHGPASYGSEALPFSRGSGWPAPIWNSGALCRHFLFLDCRGCMLTCMWGDWIFGLEYSLLVSPQPLANPTYILPLVQCPLSPPHLV